MSAPSPVGPADVSMPAEAASATTKSGRSSCGKADPMKIDASICAACGRQLMEPARVEQHTVLKIVRMHARTRGCEFHPNVLTRLVNRFRIGEDFCDPMRVKAEETLLELVVPPGLKRVFNAETGDIVAFMKWISNEEVQALKGSICTSCNKLHTRTMIKGEKPKVAKSLLQGHLMDDTQIDLGVDSDDSDDNQRNFDCRQVEKRVLRPSARHASMNHRRYDVQTQDTCKETFKVRRAKTRLRDDRRLRASQPLREREHPRKGLGRRHGTRSAEPSVHEGSEGSRLKLPHVRGARPL